MKNKGFSLVELIVVIAIMAILVGVAVPVYTSYIEKSQKAKDEQMIDEIKHAIEIAAIGDSWATKLTPGVVGTIVITGENMTVNDETTAKLLEKALNDTFGANNSLKLSYDGWDGSLSGASLSAIANSNFKDNPEALMTDIQILTDAIKGIDGLENMGGAQFNEYLAKLAAKGYDITDPQVIGNATVLYAADRAMKASAAEPDANGLTFADRFVASWKAGVSALAQNHLSENELGGFGTMAASFAWAEAFVNACACDKAECVAAGACTHTENKKCPVIRGVIAPFMDSTSDSYFGKDVTSVQDAMQKLTPLTTAMTNHVDNCDECSAFYAGYGASEASTNDAKAYLALLGQVNASEEKLLGEISNKDMYSDGTVINMVNGYVAAADALVQLQNNGGLTKGAVVISVSMDSNGSVVLIAYPMDLVK